MILHSFPSDTDADSVEYLSQANEKSEWMCGYVKITIGYSANIVLNSILSIYLCWRRNSAFEVQQFYHPLIIVLVALMPLKETKNDVHQTIFFAVIRGIETHILDISMRFS